jgi:hypothetical protein
MLLQQQPIFTGMKMTHGTTLLAAVGLISGTISSAWAHHGWSGYDAANLVTLSGTVRDVGYESPHAQIHLDASGKVWVIILAPPSRMTNRGIPAGMLKAGQTVEVQGYTHRTETNEFRAERIIVDGKTVELR